MEPLELIINKPETRKAVQKHMKSLKRLKFLVTADLVKISAPPTDQIIEGTGSSSKDKLLLSKIEMVDEYNQEIVEYVEFVLNGLNLLDNYERNLLIYKYFFELDNDELQEKFGYGIRKLRIDLAEAELNLSFRLDCVSYKDK